MGNMIFLSGWAVVDYVLIVMVEN